MFGLTSLGTVHTAISLVAAGPENPKLQSFIGTGFLLYLIICGLQVKKLRGVKPNRGSRV
jgi:hypothetical protein